jgi:hypothetical protein
MRKYSVLLLYLLAPLILVFCLFCDNNSDGPDDLYIEILKFGKANLGNPISYDELESYLNETGLEYNEFAAMYLFSGAYVDESNPGGNQFRVTRDSKSFYLHMGGYSELLNYLELQEARESSRKAILIAALAIVVSILIPLISRLFQMKPNTKPIKRKVNLDEDNVDRIQNPSEEKAQEKLKPHGNIESEKKRENDFA